MKYSSLVLTIFLFGCMATIDSQPMTEGDQIKKYLEHLAQSGYDNRIMPKPSDDKPLQVNCTMYILDIYEVDEKKMEYTAQFYFRQTWDDSRLAFPDMDLESFTLRDAKDFWTPDLFFRGAKNEIRNSLIHPNVFVRISKNGNMFFSCRFTVTFSCRMDFRKYPHDSQKCILAIESFGYKRSTMEATWYYDKPVGISKDIDDLSFRVADVKDNIEYEKLSTGEYINLQVELTFERKSGLFVTRMYLPHVFLVVLSWLSFWIPARLTIPRLSLLLVLMYLMANVRSDVNCYAPRSSYTKGSDVWMAVCESLIFASFLEFVAVYILTRNKDNLYKEMSLSDPDSQNAMETNSKVSPVNGEPSNDAVNIVVNRLKRDVLLPNRIDKTSSVLFPVLFIFFNFVYWLVYCTGQ